MSSTDFPAPGYRDEPTEGRPSGGGSKLTKFVAGAAALCVLAFGAGALTKSNSPSSTSTASPATAAQGGVPGATAQGGQAAPSGGQVPPGFGTAVSGSTLSKLTSVATAKYPGTVERAMQLTDGSYVVHVIRSSGSEVHVLVSKDFTITGVDTGGPGGPPPGATNGQAPTAPSTGTTTQ